jgi:hypothetical protein
MIATLCVSRCQSISSIGTNPCGFIARYASAFCSPAMRLTGTLR